MAETVIVQGTGGGIFEMDIPTEDHASERFAAALAKGDLRVLDPSAVELVELDGARRLVLKASAGDDEPAKAAKARKA